MLGKITGRHKKSKNASSNDESLGHFTPNISKMMESSIAAKVQLTDKSSERYFIHQLNVSPDEELLNNLKNNIMGKPKSWAKTFVSYGGMHSLSVVLMQNFSAHYNRHSVTNLQLNADHQAALMQDPNISAMSGNTLVNSNYNNTNNSSFNKRKSTPKPLMEIAYNLLLGSAQCISAVVDQTGIENLFVTRDFLTNLAAVISATPFSSPVHTTSNNNSDSELNQTLLKIQIEVFEIFQKALMDYNLTEEQAIFAIQAISASSEIYHESLRFSHMTTSLRRALLLNIKYYSDSSTVSIVDKRLLDSYITAVLKFIDGYILLGSRYPEVCPNVAQEMLNLGFMELIKMAHSQKEYTSPNVKEHIHNILHSNAFDKYAKDSLGNREYLVQMIDQLYSKLENTEPYSYLVTTIQHLVNISNTSNCEFILNNWKTLDKILSGSIHISDEEDAEWDTSPLSKVDDRYLHLQDKVLSLQILVRDLQTTRPNTTSPRIPRSRMSASLIPKLSIPPMSEMDASPFGTGFTVTDRTENSTDTHSEGRNLLTEYEDVKTEWDDERSEVDMDTETAHDEKSDKSDKGSSSERNKGNTRILYVEEIEEPQISETLFSQFVGDRDMVISQDELLKLFSGTQAPLAKKNYRRSFIDQKRAKAISYELETIKLSYDEIRQCILDMDQTRLTERNITALAKIVPSQLEADVYKAFRGSFKELSNVDQFFYTLRDIPDLQGRMEAWVFKIRYKDILAQLWPDIECLVKACAELKNSQKWFELLKVILTVANFLNKSAGNESVIHGFRVQSLLKLKDIRSVDNRTTMMHYLSTMIDSQYPHLIKFDEELLHVQMAAKITEIHSINLKRMNMSRSIKKIESLLKQTKVIENDKFCSVMREFVLAIRPDFNTKIEQPFNLLMSELDLIAKLYSEDPLFLKERPGQFFKVIQQFITLFKDPLIANGDLNLEEQDPHEDSMGIIISKPLDQNSPSDVASGVVTARRKKTVKEPAKRGIQGFFRREGSRSSLQPSDRLSASQSGTFAPLLRAINSSTTEETAFGELDPADYTITADDLLFDEETSMEKMDAVCTALGLKKKDFVVPSRRYVFEGRLWSLHTDVKKLLEYQAYLFNDVLVLHLQTQVKPGVDGDQPVAPYSIISLEDMHIKNTPKTTFYKNAFCLQNFKGDKTVVLIEKNQKTKERWEHLFRKILEPAFFSKQWQRKITAELAESMENQNDTPDQYYVYDLNKVREDYKEIIDEQDVEEGIQYIPNTTDITFSSLHKLLFKLTDFEEADNNYLYSFMLTYKAFITTEDLLNYLMRRYNTPPPEEGNFYEFKRSNLLPLRLRIVKILMYWINEHFYNFRDTISLQTRLRKFITEEIDKTKMSHAAERLLQVMNSKGRQRDTFSTQQLQKQQLQLAILQKEIADADDDSLKQREMAKAKLTGSQKDILQDSLNGMDIDKFPDSPPVSARSRGKSRMAFGKLGAFITKFNAQELSASPRASVSIDSELTKSDIMTFPAIDIARQLTFVEFQMFERIQPKECLNQAWNSANQRTKAPNLHAMISRTNQMVEWVAYEILQEEQPKARAKVISKFIKICEELRNLHNFNTLKGIVGGLNCNAIHRLKKTWALVQDKHKESFQSLALLVGQQNNYKAMRDAMEKCQACIPYIGMYLTDLTFIDDGNRDTKEGSEDLINFFKQRQLSCVIRNIQNHQRKPFNFNDHPLREKLKNLTLTTDENALYELSLKREPRT